MSPRQAWGPAQRSGAVLWSGAVVRLRLRVGVGVGVGVRVGGLGLGFGFGFGFGFGSGLGWLGLGLGLGLGHLVLSVQPAALALGTLVPEVAQRDTRHRRVTEGDPQELLELVGVPEVRGGVRVGLGLGLGLGLGVGDRG